MKIIRSVCTVALSAASASAFAGPAVVGRSAAVSRSSAYFPTVASLQQRSMSSSASQLHMSSAADFVNAEIANNKVVVFSKSYCPFCKKTKELFEDLGVQATVFELNQMDDGADIQDALLEITGQRTVPNTFIGGKHIGGNDAAQELNASGELKKLVEA